MSDKKRNRPHKHAMLHSDFGRLLLQQIAGENRCERSYLNLCYQQNVIGVFQEMQERDNGEAREVAEYWLGRFKVKAQGLKTLFYEMGKIDGGQWIEKLLIKSYELIKGCQKVTMTELKECVVTFRKSMI